MIAAGIRRLKHFKDINTSKRCSDNLIYITTLCLPLRYGILDGTLISKWIWLTNSILFIALYNSAIMSCGLLCDLMPKRNKR